ncbi:MOSC domain-containing protein [Deinococcus sp. KNUC1210]|uniref:MOSC domain-containing protein n=1 Tax=Deinococcus sp. KNUC1210 TaxID=2917691 RepID=UPI001EF02FB0|nr:MOSC domain-containing protein [Deinococcus sp. KNUC1210]ULH15915.1 MOSC domain-containing protein [Deinococcus sp. KNUC1210]
MKIESVNIGEPKDIVQGNGICRSGIDKQPVAGAVQVGPLGLTGDHILSTKHHGGPDQAVYLYSLEDYRAFEGVSARAGLFGENLTVEGLESVDVRIGTRLYFSTVVLEVTAPRIPCVTFAAHVEDPAFVKVFRQMRRPGLYTRVIQEGAVTAGEVFTLEEAPADAPTVGELFELYYNKQASRARLERALSAPIAVRTREDYLERLQTLA